MLLQVFFLISCSANFKYDLALVPSTYFKALFKYKSVYYNRIDQVAYIIIKRYDFYQKHTYTYQVHICPVGKKLFSDGASTTRQYHTLIIFCNCQCRQQMKCIGSLKTINDFLIRTLSGQFALIIRQDISIIKRYTSHTYRRIYAAACYRQYLCYIFIGLENRLNGELHVFFLQFTFVVCETKHDNMIKNKNTKRKAPRHGTWSKST